MRTRTPLSLSHPLLAFAVFVIVSTFGSCKIFAQQNYYWGMGNMSSFYSNNWSNQYCPTGTSAPHNSPMRIGLIGALAINIHDAQFNIAPFTARIRAYEPLLSGNTNAAVYTPGTSFGLSLEAPLAEQLSLGLRFLRATHGASLPVPPNNSMNVSLTTTGIETIGIFRFDDHWRAYLGASLVCLSENTYSFRTDAAGSPVTEVPRGSFVIFSPLVGIGYDIVCNEDAKPNEGRWFLTPELIAMKGTNSLTTAIADNEHWLVSQIRLGFSVQYDWPSPERAAFSPTTTSQAPAPSRP